MIPGLRPFLAEVRAGRRPPDEAALTEALYQRWFIGWRPPRDQTAQAAGDDRLVAALARAAGVGTWWATGWVVTGRHGRFAFVDDGTVTLHVDAFRELSPKNARIGAEVRLRLPCARACATPGFFLLVSKKGRAPPVHDKLYLHLTPAGGEAVIRRLSVLEARFEAKVANAREAYGRRDSGVVYVDPRDRRRVVRALLRLPRRLFRARVPPMTLSLGRGLAVAESHPVDGEGSFGEERCRLVARALLAARAGPRPLAHHLARVFADAGLDASAPWARAAKR